MNLFGRNLNHEKTGNKKGIFWRGFKGDKHSLSQVIMAVRPMDYEAKSKQIKNIFTTFIMVFFVETVPLTDEADLIIWLDNNAKFEFRSVYA